MAAPRVTLRLLIGRDLMERIQTASHELDLLPSDLIERAVVAELSRFEIQRHRERSAIEALQRSVLAEGQSLRIENEDVEIGNAVCQLCLREIPRPRHVDGPLLCDACYALAQGGETSAGQR